MIGLLDGSLDGDRFVGSMGDLMTLMNWADEFGDWMVRG